MQAADNLMRILERILRPARVPAADETWRRIEGRLTSRRRLQRFSMLAPYAAILLLALAVAGIGVPVPGMAPWRRWPRVRPRRPLFRSPAPNQPFRSWHHFTSRPACAWPTICTNRAPKQVHHQAR
jgi:hypothetical protein